jgi:hypothetical protein
MYKPDQNAEKCGSFVQTFSQAYQVEISTAHDFMLLSSGNSILTGKELPLLAA